MPIVKVLRDRRFGEGWKIGDVVAMDWESARVPLEEGSVEMVSESPEIVAVKEVETKQTEVFICTECGKVCKNKIGLSGHMKSHKSIQQ